MPRRGRGEGSLEQLPSGKWRAVYTSGKKPDGSQRKAAATFDRHRDALAWLNEQLSLRRRDKLCEPSRMPLDCWMAQWLGGIKSRIEPGSFRFYKKSIAPIERYLGDAELAQLSPLIVEQAVTKMADEGLSPSGQRHALKVLRLILKDACRLKLIYDNPAQHVKPPRDTSREMRCWTPEEANRFLRACLGHRLYALFRFALDTGMRQGEISGLHWPDVDLADNVITVRHSLEEIDSAYRLKAPKTARSRRRIWCCASTAMELEAHRRCQQKRGFDTVRGPVFTNLSGNWCDRRCIRRPFLALMKKAGVPKIRFHDIRHTNATLLLKAGVPVKTVSERLGHSSVVITLKTYAHVLPGEQEAVAEVTEKLFRPLSHPHPTENGPCTGAQVNGEAPKPTSPMPSSNWPYSGE